MNLFVKALLCSCLLAGLAWSQKDDSDQEAEKRTIGRELLANSLNIELEPLKTKMGIIVGFNKILTSEQISEMYAKVEAIKAEWKTRNAERENKETLSEMEKQRRLIELKLKCDKKQDMQKNDPEGYTAAANVRFKRFLDKKIFSDEQKVKIKQAHVKMKQRRAARLAEIKKKIAERKLKR